MPKYKCLPDDTQNSSIDAANFLRDLTDLDAHVACISLATSIVVIFKYIAQDERWISTSFEISKVAINDASVDIVAISIDKKLYEIQKGY